MVVHYDDLTRDTLGEMGFRETIQDIPADSIMRDETLTKLQLLALVMIQNSGTKGYGQIRHYRSGGDTLVNGAYMPSKSVPRALEEKGYVSITEPKQVSRRTGRGSNGFEKKKEGGYVRASNIDSLDDIAGELGFRNSRSEEFVEFVVELLRDHPKA